MVVPRNGHHAFTLIYGLGEFPVLTLVHLKAVGRLVAACAVQIGWVATVQNKLANCTDGQKSTPTWH